MTTRADQAPLLRTSLLAANAFFVPPFAGLCLSTPWRFRCLWCAAARNRRRSSRASPDRAKILHMADCIASNLHGPTFRPFVTWKVGRPNVMRLARGELALMVGIDVAGLLWLSHSIGMSARLASRRETAQLAQKFGGTEMATWAGRAVTYTVGEATITHQKGLFARFVVDLTTPAPFLRKIMSEDRAQFAIEHPSNG